MLVYVLEILPTDKLPIRENGATFYYMLTGRKPFAGKKALEVIRLQKSGKIMPLEQIKPEIPDDVFQIIQKMMAPDPDDRYQSNSEILSDIGEAKKTRPK